MKNAQPTKMEIFPKIFVFMSSPFNQKYIDPNRLTTYSRTWDLTNTHTHIYIYMRNSSKYEDVN